MSKETFQQMVARVTAKQSAVVGNNGAPPKPPKLSPAPVKVPSPGAAPKR